MTPNRLRAALPEEVADKVLKEMDTASARRLPAAVLEHRALELAAKGASPADILHEIAGQHRALWIGREALRAGDRAEPTEDEIEAAAAVLRQGVDDAALVALAKATPPERSLTVPLFAASSLMERGLPADDVLAAMHIWLEGNASDAELRDLAGPTPRSDLSVIRASGSAPAGAGQRRRTRQ